MNVEILEETIRRFNEIEINSSFIENAISNYNNYNNNKNQKKEIEKIIKKTVEMIINKKDINAIIPSNFNITNDINDNINRIIYWCFYSYFYPNKYLSYYNKKTETDINIRFKELHKCVLAQQQYFYDENIKINKQLLLIKKEYKRNMIIIINIQVFIIALIVKILFYIN